MIPRSLVGNVQYHPDFLNLLDTHVNVRYRIHRVMLEKRVYPYYQGSLASYVKRRLAISPITLVYSMISVPGQYLVLQ
jgi:hypothetical protein